MTEVIRVKTKARLYNGAVLRLAGGELRRVVREDVSVWRDGWHRTFVEVEPTAVDTCAIEAELVDANSKVTP